MAWNINSSTTPITTGSLRIPSSAFTRMKKAISGSARPTDWIVSTLTISPTTVRTIAGRIPSKTIAFTVSAPKVSRTATVSGSAPATASIFSIRKTNRSSTCPFCPTERCATTCWSIRWRPTWPATCGSGRSATASTATTSNPALSSITPQRGIPGLFRRTSSSRCCSTMTTMSGWPRAAGRC